MFPIIKPMLATYSKPFDSLDYTYEIKWDGYRCLAYLDSGTRLISRNQKDLSITFPELLQIHKKIKSQGTILDGELIALRDGKPNFFELQKRRYMTKKMSITAVMKKIPVVYVIFDILFLNYKPVYNKPIENRRSILRENLMYSDELIFTDFVDRKGKAYFESVTSLGLEGVVAKKIGSLYYPGKRSKIWYKFKKRKTLNFIVCGLEIDDNKNPYSIILGAYIADKLHYFGSVSSGLTLRNLQQTKKELEIINTAICPFDKKEHLPKNIFWVKPVIICEVEYLDFTDSLTLRDPVFKNFSSNLRPEEIQF